MEYVTRKKAPKEDQHLKVLQEIQKVVGGLAKEIPVKVETVLREAPGYGKTVNSLSGLLVTAIKQNEAITKVHAAQITGAVSEMRKVQPKKAFHLDVMRDNEGYIKAVEGTIG